MGEFLRDLATSDQFIGQLVAASAVIVAATLPPLLRRFHRRTRVRELLELLEKIPDELPDLRDRYVVEVELELELLLDKEFGVRPSEAAGRTAPMSTGETEPVGSPQAGAGGPPPRRPVRRWVEVLASTAAIILLAYIVESNLTQLGVFSSKDSNGPVLGITIALAMTATFLISIAITFIVEKRARQRKLSAMSRIRAAKATTPEDGGYPPPA